MEERRLASLMLETGLEQPSFPSDKVLELLEGCSVAGASKCTRIAEALRTAYHRLNNVAFVNHTLSDYGSLFK